MTNQHDPTDTLETFQPVTVGIHVQEMKGFRKELILSLLAPNAFEEGKEDTKSDVTAEKNNKTTEKDNKDNKKATKRSSQATDATRKKPKLFPVS